VSGRLDEDKLDQLRRWGTGLAAEENQEVRATGRAILLLIEEIEALHVELWNAKAAVAVGGEATDAQDDSGGELARTLGARLRRLRRGSSRRER
jgi:hypothetical protein